MPNLGANQLGVDVEHNVVWSFKAFEVITRLDATIFSANSISSLIGGSSSTCIASKNS